MFIVRDYDIELKNANYLILIARAFFKFHKTSFAR